MKSKTFAISIVGLFILLSIFSSAAAQGEVLQLPPEVWPTVIESDATSMESSLQDLETIDGSSPVAEGLQNQSMPVVAYNSTEYNYLAVWVDMGTPASLRGRLLSEAGVPLGEEFIVTSSTVGDPFRSEMVYSPESNTYLLLWSEANGGVSIETYCASNCIIVTLDTYNLYALSLAADGSPLATPPTLITNQATFYDDQTGSGIGSRPAYDLAYNSQASEFLIAWEQPRGVILGNWVHPHRVWGVRVGTNGQTLGQPSELVTGVISGIRTVYNEISNCYLVVFDRYGTPAYYDLYIQVVQADSLGIVGSLVNVSGYAPGNQGLAHLAFDPQVDNYLMAWWDDGGTDKVKAQKVQGGTGVPVGSSIVVLSASEDVFPMEPGVAYSPLQQQFLVVAGVGQSPDLTGQYVIGGFYPALTGNAFPIMNSSIEWKLAAGGRVGTPQWLAVWNHIGDIYKATFPSCLGGTLSPAAQAVQTALLYAVPAQQAYWCNHYDNENGLIILPPGEAAFQRFNDLAQEAHYEIDFTTMLWSENGIQSGDSPGRIFLNGVKNLYTKVQDPVSNGLPADYFSEGVRIRILIGLRKNSPLEIVEYLKTPPPWTDLYQEQHARVMEDISDLEIPLVDTNWEMEVALYNATELGTHSHVKLMIVDGNRVITGGYNMQYDYLNGSDRRDMGIEVSGPIASRALFVFDKLWMDAISCVEVNENGDCVESTAFLQHHPILDSVTSSNGDDIVFSLYRDRTDKTADNAITAAINAANSNVYIMQDRFTNGYNNVAEYARAVLNTLEKEGSQVNVKLLVSSSFGSYQLSVPGICALKYRLHKEDPSKLQYFDARYSNYSVHTKALSIDNSLVIVGSQNFDFSAFGNSLSPSIADYDLAEYSLAIDSTLGTNSAADEFDSYFMTEWDSTNSKPVACPLEFLILQNEIDQAEDGSIIFIPAGIYTESITIDKPLVLIGAGGNQTIIHPEGNQPAFRIMSSDVEISNMKISGGDGYGIELVDSSPSSLENIRINRIVFENNAQGGVLVEGLIPGSPMDYAIENNTFIWGADGVAINMIETQAETSVIRNNIFFWQSVAPVHILSADDSRVEYSYNLFDECGGDYCATNWYVGNLSASSSAHDNLFDLELLFTDPDYGAYQLSAGSPAIDAGDPELLHDFLYDGDDDGAVRIDIGAFEYAPVENVPPLVDAGDGQTVDLGNSVTINATYTDADNPEDHSAMINWDDGIFEYVPVDMTGPGAGEVTGQHTYSDPGDYAVTTCVIDLYGGVGCDTAVISVLAPSSGTTEINIGETYVLPYDDYDNGNELIAQHTTLSQEATIQSLSFYVTEAAGKLRLGLYDDVDGNPGTLVAQTDEFTPVVGWNTQSVQASSLLPAGSYWLAYLPESDNLHFRYGFPGVGEFTGRNYHYSYGELPATFSTSAQAGEFQFSFYATFTIDTEPGTIYAGEINVLHDEISGASDSLVVQIAELPQNAVVQSMSFYVSNVVGKVRLGIYTDEADRPGALVAQTDEFTPTVGWNTRNVQSPILLPAGTYWLAFLPENNDLEFQYEWIPGLYTSKVYGYPFGEMPASVSGSHLGLEYRFSLYATLIADESITFPTTSILDDFNRADGAIGSNWFGDTTAFSILSNQLNVNSNGGFIGWNEEVFDSDQEAYVTLSQLNTSIANEHSLILKAQEDSAIGVSYDGLGQALQVWTYDGTHGWVLRGSEILVTLQDGDTFGARARPDGLVQVFHNGTIVGIRNVRDWPYYAGGGSIGLEFYNAQGAVVDDFGGGTVSGGEMLMAPTGGVSQSSPSDSLEFQVTDSQLKAEESFDKALLQGIPADLGQEAYLAIPRTDSGKPNLSEKPRSYSAQNEGDIKVVYDVAGQRIHIWVYELQKGWVQHGEDISVEFVEGDRFRAQVRPDGMLEIYRNGKLLAEQDVYSLPSTR